MERHKPKITAASLAEFTELEESIKDLPNSVIEQIETVSKHFNIMLDIKKTYETEIRILVPKTCTQIHNFGDYIGIYCDKLFFRYFFKSTDKHISYVFVDSDK